MMTSALETAYTFFNNLAELSRHKGRLVAVLRGSDGQPFASGYSDLQIKDTYDLTHSGRTRFENDGPFRSDESHIYYERCDQILNVASPDFNEVIEIDLYPVEDVGKTGVTPVRTLLLFQSPVIFIGPRQSS